MPDNTRRDSIVLAAMLVAIALAGLLIPPGGRVVSWLSKEAPAGGDGAPARRKKKKKTTRQDDPEE